MMDQGFEGAPSLQARWDDREASDPRVMYRWIDITNFGHLLDAYGQPFAQALEGEIKHRLESMDILELAGVSVDAREERLYLRASLNDSAHMDDNLFDEMVVMTISSRPFVIDGQAIIAEAAVKRIDAHIYDTRSSRVTLERGRIKHAKPRLVTEYVQNMAGVVDVYKAVADGRVTLFTQPIRAMDSSRVLYHECLARIKNHQDDAECMLPDEFIPVLEETGFTRYFDRFVVRKAIDLLRQDESIRLGCNISAISAVDDAWWASTFKILAMTPNVAVRLIIELTETAECADIDAAYRFCERLRDLGCRVAVDDFGKGYSSIGFSLSVKPDMVKVDIRVVRSLHGSDESQLLQHLSNLLSDLAPQVVAEGVETEEDYEAARRAGIKWLQGRYLGSAAPYVVDGSPRIEDVEALIRRLASMGETELHAPTPHESVNEYIHRAQAIAESPDSGLSVDEAAAVVTCYSDMLYRGLCGLPKSPGKSKPSRFPRKTSLSDEAKSAVEAVGASHGAALRAQWRKISIE
jgi:EAL domain-containing protein (putative c-di-GMP-specific phosphodiesterase class I)